VQKTRAQKNEIEINGMKHFVEKTTYLHEINVLCFPIQGESRGLVVEHLAHDQKVVGLIPVQC